MEFIQKIEFSIVILLLVLNILILIANKELVSNVFLFGSENQKKAPSDFISEDKIIVYPDKLVLDIKDYTINRYAPTGSMIPVLDKGANGISIKPKSEEELNVGDIVTFWIGEELIVHRIIKKGQGNYF